MGKGKLEKFAQVSAFENCVEPSMEEAMHQGLTLKGKWMSEFFKNDQNITLELACGGGEYSVALAKLYPQKNFLGIDIKGNRLWKGAKIANAENIQNVGFLRTRIDFIENCFAQDEIEDLWITFPDPQPQNNRKRKRLTHPIFLNRYRNILKNGGKIKLKTDSDFLYQYTLKVIEDFKLTTDCNIADVYQNISTLNKALAEELNVKTFYEKMWLSEGKKIKYLSFYPPTELLEDAKSYLGLTWEEFEANQK